MTNKKSRGIVIDRCTEVTLENNHISGFVEAISASNSTGVIMSNNTIVSPEKLETLAQLRETILGLDVNKTTKDSYINALQDLYKSAGKETFHAKLGAFRSLVADSITILGPFINKLF